jgi:hypothetical protein
MGSEKISSTECRAKTLECYRLSHKLTSYDTRLALLRLVVQWGELADLIDQLNREHPLQPPLRLISRLTVEGDRSRPCAIRRIDRPAAMPREISSRSSSRSATKALRRSAGAIPPLPAKTR